MRICSFCRIAAGVAVTTLSVAAQQVHKPDDLSRAGSGADDFVYAEKLLKDGYPELAIVQFRQFLARYPAAVQAPEALRAIGAAHLALKDFGAAKETFALFEARYPNHHQIDDVRWQLAETFVLLHEPRAAASTFERLAFFSPAGPQAPSAWYRAAALWISSRDHRRGRELLYKLMEEHPTSELRLPAHLLLVESLQQEGDTQRAVREADRLFRSFPAADVTAEAHFVRARLLEQVGQLQLAEEAYSKLTQIFEEGEWPARAQARLAEIAYSHGDFGLATQLLHKAASRLPEGLEKNSLMVRLAALLIEWREHEKALAILKDFAPAVADSAQLLQFAFALGVANEENNDFQNAVKAYEQAMSSSASVEKTVSGGPSTWRWPRQRSFLRAAACEATMHHPDRALAYCAAYRQEYPKGELRDAALFQEAGIRRQEYRDETLAGRLYQQIIEDFPVSRLVDDAQFELAATYEQIGELRRATLEYERLLEHYAASEYCREAEQRRRLLVEFTAPADDRHFASLTRLISEISSGNLPASVPLELGKLALQHRDIEAANGYFKQALQQKDDAATTEAALFHLGKAYALMAERAALQREENVQAWRDSAAIALSAVITRNDGASPFAEEAGVLLARLRFTNRDMLTTEATLLQADSILARHAANPELDFLRLWGAQARMVLAKSDSMQAARLLLALQKLAVQQRSRWRNEALYSLANWRWQSGDTTAALQTCATLEGTTHNDVFRAQGLLLRADILAGLKRYGEAADVVKRCEQEYFYSTLADSARQRRVRYLIRANRFREAISVMETSAANLTDGAEVDGMALQRARAYEAAANYPLAIQAYLRFLREQPQASEAAAALLAAAQLTGKVGAKELSRRYAEECVRRFPKSPEASAAKQVLADYCFENQEFDQARRLYQDLAREAGDSGVQRLAAKQAIMCVHKTPKGVVTELELKAFQQQFPEDKNSLAEFQYAAGEQALANKDFESADRIFVKIRRSFKDTPSGILGDYGLSKSLLLQNRAQEALELLTDIPRRYPAHPFLPAVYLGLGDFYQSQQQWDNAITSFNKVVQDSSFDGNYRLAVRSLINCYDRMGLWDRALGLLRDYLGRFPDDAYAFDMRMQIGIFLMNLMQYDDAIAHLRKLKLFAEAQTEPEIQYYIAKSYMNAGRFELAIPEFLRVKYFSKPTKLPWDVTALYEAGICFTRLKNYEKARGLFQQIVREQGAESNFGRFARERIKELDQLLSQSDQTRG